VDSPKPLVGTAAGDQQYGRLLRCDTVDDDDLSGTATTKSTIGTDGYDDYNCSRISRDLYDTTVKKISAGFHNVIFIVIPQPPQLSERLGSHGKNRYAEDQTRVCGFVGRHSNHYNTTPLLKESSSNQVNSDYQVKKYPRKISLPVLLRRLNSRHGVLSKEFEDYPSTVRFEFTTSGIGS